MRSAGLLFLLLHTYFLFAADPPPSGPKNKYCAAVLDAAGTPTVKEWLTAKVTEAERAGIPRDSIYRLAGLSQKHFNDLLSGKVTNLGTESTKKLEKVFDDLLTPPATDVATVNAKLSAILERLDALADRKARQRALYTEHPDAVAIEPELASKTETIEGAIKHYLTDVKTSPGRLFGPDILSGKMGKYTWRVHDDPRERFLQTDFEGNTRPGDTPVKVYINLPQNSALPAEVSRLAELAEKNDAGSFKFLVVSRLNLPDRMVAYFAKPQDALRFAEAAAKDLKERGVSGGGMPYAFRVGDSPVSIGVDPQRRQSWRNKVTEELATARDLFGEHPNRAELTRRYLLNRGIDPETWLPVDFVERHRDRLRALATP